MKLQIILGSTRDARFGDKVSTWVEKVAREQGHFSEVELVDVKDFDLPLYNEAAGPKYIGTDFKFAPQAKQWADKVAEADAYVFVHTEYNHSVPGALKNAIDYVYAGWNKKPVAFVGYGAAVGASRATEHLRQIVAELEMADIRQAVNLIAAPFGAFGENGPKDPQVAQLLQDELTELAWWSNALKVAREQ